MFTRIALALFIIVCGPGAAPAHAAGERPGGFFASRGETFSPNLAWWAVDPFTDPEGVLWIGVDGTGPDAISRVRLQVGGPEAGQATSQSTGQTTGQTMRQTTRIATSRTYHPDRNVAAFWFALDSIPETTRKIQVVAVVEHENQAPALLSSPVIITRNQIGWDTRAFAAGWSLLRPAPDSRLVYVAANGTDVLAAAVHGRGHYLPHDPEIGPDPSNPIGPITAYATPEVAMRAMRLTNWLGTRNGRDLYGDACGYNQKKEALGHDWQGYPDWLLYRRGDDFRGHLQPDREEIRPRHHGLRQRGRSANQPMVITAWGRPETRRPILDSWRVIGHAKHLRLVSLDLSGRMHWDTGAQSQTHSAWWAEDIVVEDVRARGLGASNHAAWDQVLVRRGVIIDMWDADAHNQGLYIANAPTAGQPVAQGPAGRFWPEDGWRIEETVFDRNGYKQDPNQPRTWTRDVNRTDELTPGTGVQPARTFFDHNLYAASYARLHLRANLFSRNGGGGSVQMRLGGIADRNLFLWNESALNTSHPKSRRDALGDAAIRENVVLHDDHFLPPGGFGQGLRLGIGPDRVGVMQDNIAAHFHRINNSGGMFTAGGIEAYAPSDPTHALPPLRGLHATIARNIGIAEATTNLLVHGPDQPDGLGSACVSENVLVNLRQGEIVDYRGELPVARQAVGNCGAGGNHYVVRGESRFQWGEKNRGDFRQWRVVGFDARPLEHVSLPALAAALGWNSGQNNPAGWERDIVSYMRRIDPTYIPDEHVFVDAGAGGPRQWPRQKVWEALAGFDQFPHDGGVRPRMSVADAKRAAQRYHAFLAFIHQARQNRKHAWDHRYTAQALASYMRDGFNLPSPGIRGHTPLLPAPYLGLGLGLKHQDRPDATVGGNRQ